MERVKKWFSNRKLGSMESLNVRSVQDSAHGNKQESTCQTAYELTSIKIKQLLEKEQFQKVVDSIRELPREYVLSCLESFPFIALNKAVPRSFLIWETLLTKLHNSEEGYIPQFPYKACDELVMNIAWLLENNSDEEQGHSYKRVLKCVYMQYNEVLERLYKEHDRVEYALYTLGLHSPLGTDPRLALTIEQAIKEEVQACLEDYTTALEQLEDYKVREVIAVGDMLKENQVGSEERDPASMEMFLAPSPTQVQLHERLYQNQRVYTSLQPSRRTGTLQQLLELLNERIHGDKEVISIFGRIRDKDLVLSDSIPVQPWLRKYQHALDLAIGTLKDIEKDLEITIPRVESPMQLCPHPSRETFPGGAEEVPQTVPSVTHRPRSRSYERDKTMFQHHRHSITPILSSPLTGEEERPLARTGTPKRNLSVPQTHRPRSTSPQKLLRVNGGGPIPGPSHALSMKSVSSSDSGSNLCQENSSSASAHDLHSTSENPPSSSLPFTRVQSLKSHNSVQVVAGKRKAGIPVLPNSFTNLYSISMGSVNGMTQSGKKHKKHGSDPSGEMAQPWERQIQPYLQVASGDGMTTKTHLLQQALESKSNELMVMRKAVQDLRKRERELIDRLSEQAQRHLQDSEKFEDILLGSNRPTLVIQRYKELFSQGRMEALDAMEGVMQELTGPRQKGQRNDAKPQLFNGEFGTRVLLDVLKFSYEAASASLEQLHSKWKDSIGIRSNESGDSVAVRQVESAVALYLRRVSSKHDVGSIIQNVRIQLSLKYSDSQVFKKVSEVEAFSSYVQECGQVCWDLCVQTPPMLIDYNETEFNFDMHTRFYESDMNYSVILLYHWPTLLQTTTGPISRGIVQT